ncbi:hypothetical protein A2U01_0106556, partial [Trifolium medium]|nr:hypothetical protein [Trifolium medium]
AAVMEVFREERETDTGDAGFRKVERNRRRRWRISESRESCREKKSETTTDENDANGGGQ